MGHHNLNKENSAVLGIKRGSFSEVRNILD